MITGVWKYRGKSIYAVGRLIEDLNLDDKKIKPIIAKCTRMDKDDRYQTIDDVAFDFAHSFLRSES